MCSAQTGGSSSIDHEERVALTDQTRPNILFVMTDQQRFDSIAALAGKNVHTPNLDRLVARGATFTNAYSTCPVCIPARYSLISGSEPSRTDVWMNEAAPEGLHERVRCNTGPFLPEILTERGYRTFGVGKFHTLPWDSDLGFEVQLRVEEEYESPAQRAGDDYAEFIRREHSEFDWIEQLHGERSNMYYMPQMSHLPASLTSEAYVADRAVEFIEAHDERPWFGFVSFIAPHPPFAPPLPYNRMYDPEEMDAPVVGEPGTDQADQYALLMNHLTYANEMDPIRQRELHARYLAEVTYVDACIGRVLDAVEAQDDADDTLLCFFSDHGESLGDHGAWQKESFFEAATHIPFLISWPARIRPERRDDLVCLTDLFGVATGASGESVLRDGIDILRSLEGDADTRQTLIGVHARPDSPFFKIMVRRDRWKLIYYVNGGVRQLFDLHEDHDERCDVSGGNSDVVDELMAVAAQYFADRGIGEALNGGSLRAEPFVSWKQMLDAQPLRASGAHGRLAQFDRSRGVVGFPSDLSDVRIGTAGDRLEPLHREQ